jgi:hypothetical protein
MAKRRPVISKWYQDVSEDEIFEVVAIDEDSDTIAIQYVDGDISEVDFETWREMVLLPAEPPDDLREIEYLDDEDLDNAREPTWEDPFDDSKTDGYGDDEDY